MRLISRVMLAAIAVLVAWRIGPAFIDGLSWFFPKFGGALYSMAPQISGHDAAFWFKFIVSIILFWLIFKGVSLVFGFMLPKAQAFGTTKAVRRLQGVSAEALLIFSLFMGVSLIDAMMRDVPRQPYKGGGKGPIDMDPLGTPIDSHKGKGLEDATDEPIDKPQEPPRKEPEYDPLDPDAVKAEAEKERAAKQKEPERTYIGAPWAFTYPAEGETYEAWMARKHPGASVDEWIRKWNQVRPNDKK